MGENLRQLLKIPYERLDEINELKVKYDALVERLEGVWDEFLSPSSPVRLTLKIEKEK